MWDGAYRAAVAAGIWWLVFIVGRLEMQFYRPMTPIPEIFGVAVFLAIPIIVAILFSGLMLREIQEASKATPRKRDVSDEPGRG